MRAYTYRRIRRHTASHEAANANKESKQEQSFFGEAAHETFFQPASAIQRKCEKCEEEDKKVQMKEDKKEEDQLQKKGSDVSSNSSTGINNYVSSLNGKGYSLPANANQFFSSRMGYNFSNVKVHTDKVAAESAKDVNAKAYTIGNNIVFNEEQFNTESNEGKKLMAHELVHVIQQNNSNNSAIKLQRMKIGEGESPVLCGETLDKVPEEEVGTINNAIAMVGKVANNPEKYPDCHSFFAESCPGGKKDTLKSTFNNVSVWKKTPTKDETAGASVCPEDTKVMAYTYVGYQAGTTALASYFMHELMHNCGIMGEEKHRLADKARLYCMGDGTKEVSVAFGKADEKVVIAFSLKKFLTEWRAGKLRPYAGLSANFLLDFQKGEESLLFAAPVAGLHHRTGLLGGGERFGGLTLGANVGLGYGRFKELPQTDADKFGWHSGLILQLHAGVEFAIPKFGTEGRVIPASLEINFTTIKPITSEAQNIQTITIGLNFPIN